MRTQELEYRRMRMERGGHARHRPLNCLIATLVVLTTTAPAFSDGAGDIEYHDVPSPALVHSVRAGIYKPLQPPPEGGWPVLYLLHGLGGNERSWATLGDIDATLDRMIASGEIAPLVVVMPDGGDGWYIDSTGSGGPGNFEAALTRNLPTWVEASFPVRTDRGGRAVAGLSMGGYGALRFALLTPDRYVAVAALSPAIWQNIGDDELDLPPDRLTDLAKTDFFERADPATVLAKRVVPPTGSHFAMAFGTPFDARFFNARNVFTLLADRLAAGDELPASYLTVGDDDSHGLWKGAIAFYETMQADNRPSELRITNGDHVWELWRSSVVDALKFVDSQFLPSPLVAPRVEKR